MESLKQFEDLLFLKNMGKSTRKMYVSTIQNVCSKLKLEPEQIGEQELRDFLLDNKQYSSSTRMSIINSFKSYYRLCLDRSFDHKILPRPKVEQKQPDILSVEEVQKIVTSIMNLKHKTIFCLMYSAGLRVGEIVNLKIKDVDPKNNRINIKNGKGAIDRVVMLDDSIFELIKKYWIEYKTSTYLFEGAKGDVYSAKSIQTFVKKYASDCGIDKKISPHSLRHSCLTQLIKDGVDLRTVQKIAGHSNINTTANYIRMIDSDILGTISPISHIDLG